MKDALDLFHEHGFSSVEIWADSVHLDPRISPDVAAVKKQLRQLGIGVHSVHAPFRNYINRPRDEIAFCRMRTDNIKKTLDSASDLECGIMVMHAVDRKEYNYPMKQLNIVRDYVNEICEYAACRGVRLAIEDIPPGNGGNEILTTLENQKKLFEGIGIHYCLDIGHEPLLGADMFQEIDAAGDRLITFHIHNNCGTCDDHLLPDDGILDWPRIHDYIRNSGFDGQFVLEVYGGKTIESEREIMRRIDLLLRQ